MGSIKCMSKKYITSSMRITMAWQRSTPEVNVTRFKKCQIFIQWMKLICCGMAVKRMGKFCVRTMKALTVKKKDSDIDW
jgi:hypothetical protein